MLKFTYNQIVDRIIQEKGISREQIDKLVDEKVKQLSDLISREGAAHIVANQLGIKLFESINPDRELKVKDIPMGISGVSLVGKVLEIRDIINFNKNGRSGRVVNFTVGDETGRIRIVVWDESIINEIEKGMFKTGDVLRIKNGYSRDNNRMIEVHLGSSAQIIVNPKGVDFGRVFFQSKNLNRKALNEVEEGDYVEVVGTVVQMFEPKFFNVCSKCGRKVYEENGKFVCKDHGVTVPEKRGVLNFFFDDGTSNIRVVGFGEVINDLVSFNGGNIANFTSAIFEEWKKEALGKQIFIEGKINRNDMFNRLELMAKKIREADPVELLNEL